MADWKDSLRPASFRNVSFYVERAETSGGRRSVTHEFPNKEIPFTEDVGRKAKDILLEAFCIGPDYMDFRDGLMTVLDKPGPGVLIHPYYGEMTLSVKTWRLTESRDDGGMAKFSITFAETGELIYPAVDDNALAKLLKAADDLEKSAADQFAAMFKAGSGKVFGFATSALKSVAGIMNKLLTPLAVATSIADTLSRDLNRLVTLATTIARRPLSMLMKLKNALKRLVNLGSAGKTVSKSYAKMAGEMDNFFGSQSTPNTPTGRRIAANNAAMNVAFNCMIVAAGARAAVQNKFVSEEEAKEVRDALADAAQNIANMTDDDAIFLAAIDLRIKLYEALPGDSANLKKVTVVEIPDTTAALPALVLAYKMYGTVAGVDDIIARNGIRNPGVLEPGSYKVLSA